MESTAALLPKLRANPDRLVIIKADKSVTYERLIQAIDAIRMAGGAIWLLLLNVLRNQAVLEDDPRAVEPKPAGKLAHIDPHPPGSDITGAVCATWANSRCVST